MCRTAHASGLRGQSACQELPFDELLSARGPTFCTRSTMMTQPSFCGAGCIRAYLIRRYETYGRGCLGANQHEGEAGPAHPCEAAIVGPNGKAPDITHVYAQRNAGVCCRRGRLAGRFWERPDSRPSGKAVTHLGHEPGVRSGPQRDISSHRFLNTALEFGLGARHNHRICKELRQNERSCRLASSWGWLPGKS